MIYVMQCVWIYITAIICLGTRFRLKKRKEIFLILTFLFFSIVMGIRDVSVGVDTETYARCYSINSNLSWHDIFLRVSPYAMELGWDIVTKICSYISSSYYLFQMLYSIVYCWLYAKFLKRTIQNPFIAAILFLGTGLYTGAFNIQRQYLSMIILANGYFYFKEKKIISTLLCLVLATLFHRTAMIFIVLLLIYQLRNRKKLLSIVPILIVIITLRYNVLIGLARKYVPVYYNYYGNYKEKQTAYGVWLIWIIIIILSIFSLYNKKMKDKDYEVICIFGMGFVACNIVGLQFNYFERLGLYFMPFIPALFYGFGKQLNKNAYKIIYYVGISLSFTAYYLLSCFTGINLEYSTFFS